MRRGRIEIVAEEPPLGVASVLVTCDSCRESVRVAYEETAGVSPKHIDSASVEAILYGRERIPHAPGFPCWNPAQPWKFEDDNPPIFERMNAEAAER